MWTKLLTFVLKATLKGIMLEIQAADKAEQKALVKLSKAQQLKLDAEAAKIKLETIITE